MLDEATKVLSRVEKFGEKKEDPEVGVLEKVTGTRLADATASMVRQNSRWGTAAESSPNLTEPGTSLAVLSQY